MIRTGDCNRLICGLNSGNFGLIFSIVIQPSTVASADNQMLEAGLFPQTGRVLGPRALRLSNS
jgi:hypothetical protein